MIYVMTNESLHFFDVHSHIYFPQFDKDREEVVARMADALVGTISVGVDYESSQKAIAIAEKYEHVYATLGLHPTDKKSERFEVSKYEELVKHPKLVAIGECGLDYFRKDKDNEGEVKRQKEDFGKQIQFALDHDKPLMLHCRPSQGTMDAYEDVLGILNSFSKEQGNLRGNVHFFVGNTTIAKQFLDLGFTLSFTGVITFARDYDDVIKLAPLNQILSETDCPFVAPEPYRGKRNEPSYVTLVVEKIALIRGEDLEVVRGQLLENTLKVFSI